MTIDISRFLLGLLEPSVSVPVDPPVDGPGFDPAISSANFTFSLANRKVVATNPGTNTAYVNEEKSTGRVYFEMLVETIVPTGMGYAVVGSATTFIIASTGNTFGVTAAGSVRVNGVAGAELGAIVVGERVCIAADFDAELFWVRRNDGNWNGSVTADPATATEGVSFAALAGGSYWPGSTHTSTNASTTAAMGGLTVLYAVPTGYSVVVGGNP